MTEQQKSKLKEVWAEHGELFKLLFAEEAAQLNQAALNRLVDRDFDEALKLKTQAGVFEGIASLF